MDRSPTRPAATFSPAYPSPPRVHWAVLLLAVLSAAALVLWLVPQPYRDFAINVVAAVWPIYLCLWVRKIDQRSSSLYWAIASLVTGFLFSWLLWIVVIFELREELLEHYNRREPIGLRLTCPANLWSTSFNVMHTSAPNACPCLAIVACVPIPAIRISVYNARAGNTA